MRSLRRHILRLFTWEITIGLAQMNGSGFEISVLSFIHNLADRRVVQTLVADDVAQGIGVLAMGLADTLAALPRVRGGPGLAGVVWPLARN